MAAGQAAGAIEEAIEAEIPLIVAVAEHIPLHDQLRVRACALYSWILAAEQNSGTRNAQDTVKIKARRG